MSLMWLKKKTKSIIYIICPIKNILIEASEKVGAMHRLSFNLHMGG